MIISKPRPLFRPELRTAPAHPLGDRVLVREFPVESKTEGGIEIADVAKSHYFAGTIVAVGDQAADKLYELGVEIGDEVWYAKYAGVIQQWQHIVKEGKEPGCIHDGSWDFVAKDDNEAWSCVGTPNENMELRSCRSCHALKLAERMIVLTGDDLILDVDVQLRLERGELVRVRGETEEGKPRYYLERTHGRKDSFETEKEI